MMYGDGDVLYMTSVEKATHGGVWSQDFEMKLQ